MCQKDPRQPINNNIMIIEKSMIHALHWIEMKQDYSITKHNKHRHEKPTCTKLT